MDGTLIIFMIFLLFIIFKIAENAQWQQGGDSVGGDSYFWVLPIAIPVMLVMLSGGTGVLLSVAAYLPQVFLAVIAFWFVATFFSKR